MKNLKRFFLTVLILSPFIGCGAGAPPASIPAPVSQRLTALPPNQDGLVGIIGAPGAVNPGANVEATNLTQGGSFSWLDLIIPKAYAQVGVVTTQADDQGGFILDIPGASGDDIAIRQEVNGDFSPETIIQVP